MPSLPILLFLLAPPVQSEPATPAACPEQTSTTLLKQANTVLQQQVLESVPDRAAALADVLMMLGCLADPAPSVAARSFLLLGAHRRMEGDEEGARRALAAAAALNGSAAWVDELGPELQALYQAEAVGTDNKGVVFAYEPLFPDAPHLVGGRGDPPWVISPATLTFSAGGTSRPVSIQPGALIVVSPASIEAFHSLVEGVSEADLQEPDWEALDAAEAQRANTILQFSPALYVGLAGVATGDSSINDSAQPLGWSGMGPTLGFQLGLRFGEHLRLAPGLGYLGVWGSVPSSQVVEEGWEPTAWPRPSMHLGFADLLLGVELGPVGLGVGPRVAVSKVSVASAVEGAATLDSYALFEGHGRLAGIHMALDWRMSHALRPQLDVAVLGDGDRPYRSASLGLAWRGGE